MSAATLSRRAFLTSSGAGGLGLILAAQQAPAAPAKRPPNLLFMHLDQWYWDAASAFGCAHVRTPAIDRLAAQGTTFSLSYSANPVCCPARACWYTGRASSENGVVMNDQWPIAPDMPDLGQCVGCRNANAAGAHNRDVHFGVESAEVPELSSGCSYHYRSVWPMRQPWLCGV